MAKTKKKGKKMSAVGRGVLVVGLGALSVIQPETVVVTIPLMLAIGKGK